MTASDLLVHTHADMQHVNVYYTLWCHHVCFERVPKVSTTCSKKTILYLQVRVCVSTISFCQRHPKPVMFHDDLSACCNARHVGQWSERQQIGNATAATRDCAVREERCHCQRTQMSWLLVRLMLCSGTLIDLSSATCECKRCHEHMRSGFAPK